MAPTLADGQWVLVHRGQHRVRPGDIAVFVSPADNRLAIKRCILDGKDKPMIRHGWLVTPWGEWFLTGGQWTRIAAEPAPKKDVLFMVGDNQFRSMDSRDYGYVGREKIVGRVLIRRAGG